MRLTIFQYTQPRLSAAHGAPTQRVCTKNSRTRRDYDRACVLVAFQLVFHFAKELIEPGHRVPRFHCLSIS